MAAPPSPEWAERILEELADLRRRLAELEERQATQESVAAKPQETPTSEEPPSADTPPPLPPDWLAAQRAPAGPSAGKPAEGPAAGDQAPKPTAPAAEPVAEAEKVVPDEGEAEKVAVYLDRLRAAAEAAEGPAATGGAVEEPVAEAEAAEESVAEGGVVDKAEPDETRGTEKSRTPADASVPPKPSLEQIVGTKWMLLAGVALLLLAGVFFFRYAYQRGWITPPRRCLTGFVLATAMLGLGEWAVRRKLRAYAVALFGVGIVWHYYTAWAASPNGPYVPQYSIIPFNWAFAYMCLVTVAGAAVAIRTGFQTTAVLALLGAFATPVLLSSGADRQVALMAYLLVVNAGFLMLAYARRWQTLAPLAMVGTVLLFALWYGNHYDPGALVRTCVFAWAFLAEFVAYLVAALRGGRADEKLLAGLSAASPAMVGVLSLVLDPSAGAFMGQLLALNAVLLALCWWQRWGGLAAGALAGVTLLLAAWYRPAAVADSRITVNVYAWGLLATFVLFSAAGVATRRTPETWARGLVAAAATVMGLLLYSMGLSASALLGQTALLAAVVLAVCSWRRWGPLGAGALFGTALLMGAWYARRYGADGRLAANVWGWVLWGLFLAYGIVESFRDRAGREHGEMIATLAGCLTGLWLAGMGLGMAAYYAQLLALSAAMLAVSLWRRWLVPVGGMLAVSIPLFSWWWYAHGAGATAMINAFAWATAGTYLVYVVAAAWLGREERFLSAGVTLVAGAALAVGLEALGLGDTAFFTQLIVLNVIVLGLCLWRRWHGGRAAMLVWTTVLTLLHWHLLRLAPGRAIEYAVGFPRQTESPSARQCLGWALWLWALYVPILVDVIVRALWRRVRTWEKLDAWLSTTATALLFAGTWRILDAHYHAWLGLYTALLGAGAIGLGLLVRFRADRRALAEAQYAQGLVLLALAVPIQFENAPVAIAWAVQCVVAMALAKWLRHWMLMVKSAAVGVLAVVHLMAMDLPRNPQMAEEVIRAWGVSISQGLLLATGLSAALLVAAAVLRWGGAVLGRKPVPVLGGTLVLRAEDEPVLACGLVALAALPFLVRTAAELPAVAAGWWWLVWTGVLAVAAWWRPSRWLRAVTAGAALVLVAKHLLYDTLNMRVHYGPYLEGWIVLNWRLGLGLVLAAGLLAGTWLMRRRPAHRRTWLCPAPPAMHKLAATCAAAGAAVVLWVVSFEIDHAMALTAGVWNDRVLAQHMALSLWWGVYAVGLLLVGFVWNQRFARYAAIALLAVTVGKVFVVDMAGVEAVYRILSFLGLGAVLLAGSLLYHRRFRGDVARMKTLSQAGEKPVEPGEGA